MIDLEPLKRKVETATRAYNDMRLNCTLALAKKISEISKNPVGVRCLSYFDFCNEGQFEVSIHKYVISARFKKEVIYVSLGNYGDMSENDKEQIAYYQTGLSILSHSKEILATFRLNWDQGIKECVDQANKELRNAEIQNDSEIKRELREEGEKYLKTCTTYKYWPITKITEKTVTTTDCYGKKHIAKLDDVLQVATLCVVGDNTEWYKKMLY